MRVPCFINFFVFALYVGAANAQVNDDRPLTVTLDAPRVVVDVVNSTGQPLTLLRVRGDVTEKVIECGDRDRFQIDVPSGIYCLVSPVNRARNQVIRVPVPAWHDALVKDSARAAPMPRDRTDAQHEPDSKSNRPMFTIGVSDQSWLRSEAGFCWIPPGPALVGDRLGVGQPDERPLRLVELPGFWIGETEVTNAQYAEFLNAQTDIVSGWLDLDSRKCRIKLQNGRFEATAPDFPVVTVTFDGATAYCRWLSEKTGRNYRLPTEDEWEKAAGGPYTFIYSYGNTYHPQRANQESGQLMAVRKFGANGFGVYDMTGNAFEWVAGKVRSTDPSDPMTAVLRGGSFVLDGMYLRNSFRMRQNPATMTDDFGFRVARDAVPDKFSAPTK